MPTLLNSFDKDKISSLRFLSRNSLHTLRNIDSLFWFDSSGALFRYYNPVTEVEHIQINTKKRPLVELEEGEVEPAESKWSLNEYFEPRKKELIRIIYDTEYQPPCIDEAKLDGRRFAIAPLREFCNDFAGGSKPIRLILVYSGSPDTLQQLKHIIYSGNIGSMKILDLSDTYQDRSFIPTAKDTLDTIQKTRENTLFELLDESILIDKILSSLKAPFYPESTDTLSQRSELFRGNLLWSVYDCLKDEASSEAPIELFLTSVSVTSPSVPSSLVGFVSTKDIDIRIKFDTTMKAKTEIVFSLEIVQCAQNKITVSQLNQLFRFQKIYAQLFGYSFIESPLLGDTFFVAPLRDVRSIDWDLIANIELSQSDPWSLPIAHIQDKAIIIAPHNKKMYVQPKMSTKLASDTFERSISQPPEMISFANYFSRHGYTSIDGSAYQVSVTPLNRLDDLLNPSDPENIHLIREACRAFPLSRLELVTFSAWAQFMDRIKVLVRLKYFQTVYGLSRVPLDQLFKAFIMVSTEKDHNFEILEVLGDAYIKYRVGEDVFSQYPTEGVDELTQRRLAVINNEHLKSLALKMGLQETLVRKCEFPSFALKRPDSDRSASLVDPSAFIRRYTPDIPQLIHGKAMADCLEALFGACANTDPVIADHFLQKLGILSAAPNIIPSPFSCITTRSKDLIKIDETIGYVFQNPHLVKLALTHPSAHETQNYQRFEFLGDAILEWLVAREHVPSNPKTAHQFIDHKRKCLHNVHLGRVAVCVGIHKLIIAKGAPEDVIKSVHEAQLVPKWIGDVVESLVGAIYIDSNRDLEKVNDVFFGWVRKFEKKYPNGIPVEDGSNVRHMHERLTKERNSGRDIEIRYILSIIAFFI